MNEERILDRFLRELKPSAGVVLGVGDDCAVVSPGACDVLLAADQVISGVHFAPEKVSPPEAGEKLLKRNLSDIAAMGGIPRWALCTVAARDWSDGEILAFLRGVREACEQFATVLTGGDLAGLPRGGEKLLVSTLSIFGTLPEGPAVARSGARPGDCICMTGKMGSSYETGHHVSFTPRLREGRTLRRYADAMMDSSDGVALDLTRMARASRVGMVLCLEALPLRDEREDARTALADGEDYELLCAVPAERLEELRKNWDETLAPLVCIGRVTQDHPGEVRSEKGELLSGGYVHEN